MKIEKSARYDIYSKKLETFSSQMLQAYDKTNILQEICTVKKYRNKKNEFFQIGKRVKLPKTLFSECDNVDNSTVAGDFVRVIVTGERDFIIHTILESGKAARYEATSFDYDEFVTILSKMDNPTDIFIPIKPHFKQFYSWVYGNKERIRFEHMKASTILIGNNEIRVRWITSDRDIKNIVVVDRKKIEVVQKTYEQSGTPKETTPIRYFSNYSNSKPLMLYFVDRDEKNFDFVFRTVISKPKITEGSAIIVDVKNKTQ